MTTSYSARGGLPRPGLEWHPGRTPFASRFGDIYFSREGGLAQARHVFLGGCALPDAWRGHDTFTICELGFGTGLNFLATWEMWRRTRLPGARLHYVAVEGYPLTRAELGACVEGWQELRQLSEALVRVYPDPQPGFHRLFPMASDESSRSVHLTLLYGEAAEVLNQLEARIDAWFLDGFAPDRNPAMWSPAVFSEMARLSRPGACFATYSVAGAVRAGLDDAGFKNEKAPGFGNKRDMLRGRFSGDPKPSALQPWFAHPAPKTKGHAAIIGSGIAGANVARALMRRGWRTTIIDRHEVAADEASGNPAGILMPRLTAAPNFDGRFYAGAWRFALETLEEMTRSHSPIRRDRCGTLQLATDSTEAGRQQAIIDGASLAPSFLMSLSPQDASDVAGCKLTQGALYFPQGGWLAPRPYCAALAHGADMRLHTSVGALRRDGEIWEVLGADGDVLLRADIVILANALQAAALPITAWMPLKARRGQITMAPPTAISAGLRSVLTYGGYITPAHEGHHSIGATFDWVDTKDMDARPVVRTEDHQRNLDDMARVLPDLMRGTDTLTLSGRAALRCTTLDHLPMAGAVPDYHAYLRDFAELRHGHPWARYPEASYQPGLYTLTGLGARGLVSAPLAAEIIASQISGEPWPVARDLATALHAGRFLVRDLKRLEV